MADQKSSGKRGGLYSKPSGNPYASLSMQDEDGDSLRQEITDEQKRAYINQLQDPYAHIAIFGDTDIMGNSGVTNVPGKLTEEWVLKCLSSYLPKSPRSRDRKVINSVASEFVAQTNALAPEQVRLVKSKLLRMKPEGGMLLDAARTTPDSIKDALWRLLNEVMKER